MTFFFAQQERWRGVWETPNEAAAFLVAVLIPLLGLMAALLAKPRAFRFMPAIFAAGCLAATLATGLWLLARTYSRGGWVGCLVGIALLGLLLPRRRQRVVAAAAAVAFVLMLALLPAGLHRAATSSQWQLDRSVANRFLVWKATLQMMAERPEGVGRGRFGRELEQWYQPPELKAFYYAALNDFLTFAAERGWAASAGALWALGVVTCGSGWMAWRGGNALMLGAMSGLAAFLAACMFSPLIFKWSVAWPAAVLFGSSILYFIIPSWRARTLRPFARPALGGLLLSSLVCASAYGGGWFLLRTLPTHHRALDLGDGAAAVMVEPRRGRVAGTIIYLPDRQTAPGELAKSTLRPLAQRGWKVICFEQPAFSVDALNYTREMIGRLSASGLHPAGRWFLAGERQGGMVALAVAAEGVSWQGAGASAVAVCGIPSASPFPEVSPKVQGARLRCPALLFFAENDIKVPAHHGQLILEAMAAGANAQLEIIPADLESDGAGWQLWIGAIDEAFRNSGMSASSTGAPAAHAEGEAEEERAGPEPAAPRDGEHEEDEGEEPGIHAAHHGHEPVERGARPFVVDEEMRLLLHAETREAPNLWLCYGERKLRVHC